MMLTCVRYYAAYPLSLRHIEEIMVERGVVVDHATVHRLGDQNPACASRCVPTAQTPCWHEMADR